MKILLKYLLFFLTISTGALFIYSAFTKLYPIQVFEYTFVEFLKLPWGAAAISARLFIGLEFSLGTLILLHFFGKRNWVLKTSFGLLVVFTFYLIYLLAKFGNKVNCGCFGDTIWMNPTTSIIKNCILLIVTAVLIRFNRTLNFKLNFTRDISIWTGLRTMRIWVNPKNAQNNSYKSISKFITPFIFYIIIVIPIIFFPIPTGKPSWLRKDNYKIDFSPVYYPENKIVPQIELNKGKQIIAFLSPFCPHCILAAYKMHLMKEKNPSLPFFIIMGGTESSLVEFWQKTKAENIPFSRLQKQDFLAYTGGIFPYIIWTDNSIVIAKSDYITLNQTEIEQWLNSKTIDTLNN